MNNCDGVEARSRSSRGRHAVGEAKMIGGETERDP